MLTALMAEGNWRKAFELLAKAHNYIDSLERDGEFAAPRETQR